MQEANGNKLRKKGKAIKATGTQRHTKGSQHESRSRQQAVRQKTWEAGAERKSKQCIRIEIPKNLQLQGLEVLAEALVAQLCSRPAAYQTRGDKLPMVTAVPLLDSSLLWGLRTNRPS